MKNGKIVFSMAVLAMLNGKAALAGGEEKAISECKSTIRENYAVDDFRNVFADKLGHHRYRVYGKVKRHGHRYPFNCTVKRGWVQSYYYDGPHGDWNNEWSSGDRYSNDEKRHRKNKKHDRNVAIGVGLAAVAIAAVAAASKQQKKHSPSSSESFSYEKHVDKTYLEDECGEELGGRIRREHNGVSSIELDQVKVEHEGAMLKGKGIIHWQHKQPSDFSYSCYFDKSGRVMDSSYRYY